MRVSETNTIIAEGWLIRMLLPGVAVISLQSTSPIFSENSVVNVCAEIQELPAGGLGTDITVDFRVDGFSAGTLENIVFLCILLWYNLCFSVEGEDFEILSSLSMVFNSDGNVANGDTLCLGLGILEDDIYEENQLLNVSIVSVSPSSAATVGTDESVITIEDNGGVLRTLIMSKNLLMYSKFQMLLLVLWWMGTM